MPLSRALAYIGRAGKGVVVVLRQNEDPRGLAERIRNFQLEDAGLPATEYDEGSELRTYGVGAQILSDLGVRRMRILSAPKTLHALSGFGMEVVEYVIPE
jgi:3,4-dihydroxy 2-butanone 4-phosphate synthase/GTP cyclohydrolase II